MLANYGDGLLVDPAGFLKLHREIDRSHVAILAHLLLLGITHHGGTTGTPMICRGGTTGTPMICRGAPIGEAVGTPIGLGDAHSSELFMQPPCGINDFRQWRVSPFLPFLISPTEPLTTAVGVPGTTWGTSIRQHILGHLGGTSIRQDCSKNDMHRRFDELSSTLGAPKCPNGGCPWVHHGGCPWVQASGRMDTVEAKDGCPLVLPGADAQLAPATEQTRRPIAYLQFNCI